MRKSRFLALILTVVFLLANVSMPTFAATQFTYTPKAGFGEVASNQTYYSAIPDHPFHFAVTANDPEDASKEYEYVTYSASSDPAIGSAATGTFTVDENGLVTVGDITPYVAEGTYYATALAKAKAVNKADPSDEVVLENTFRYVYPGISWDFEDGKFANISNVEIASDASGNHYLKRTDTSAFSVFTWQTRWFNVCKHTMLSRYYYPVVFEFDTNDVGDGIGNYGASSKVFGATFASASMPGYVPGEWNNFKVIFDGQTNNYEVYVNDKYVKSGNLTENSATNTNGAYRSKLNTMDNLKQYQTSLGFAHDVTLTASSDELKIGDTLTAGAQHYSFAKSNVPEELQVEFAASTSPDGEYTFLADGSEPLTITAEHDGLYIKARARVQEVGLHDCATEWVYSDNAVRYAAPVEFVNDPAAAVNAANVVAPLPGMPLRISHAVTDNYATYALGKSTDGITVDANGILNIGSNVVNLPTRAKSVADKVTVTLGDGKTMVGPTINNVYSSYYFNFDDGRLPNDPNYAYPANSRWPLAQFEVTSDASGRVYVKRGWNSEKNEIYGYFQIRAENAVYTRLTNLASAVWEFEACDLWSGFKFGTTTLISATANQVLDKTWLDEIEAAGATVNSNFDVEKSLRGWHKYKWVITSTAHSDGQASIMPHFDLYIDDQLVATDIPMTGVGENGSWNVNSATSNYAGLLYSNGVDNYKLYGTSLGFAYDVALTGDAVIGSTMNVSAQKATMPIGNIPEALEYAFFACDTADGTFEKISDGDSLEITSALAGKYIKAAARVKESIDGGLATEWVLSEDAKLVAPVAVSSIALTVDGVSADFDTVAITGDASVAVTITAEGVGEQAAKFVLAQYAKVDGKDILKAVDLENAVLGASDTCTLEIAAKDVDSDTEFKLFALTTEGLVPVKFISFN